MHLWCWLYIFYNCECNEVGAYDTRCSTSGQCRCRPGVGGKKCDHCHSGFWGIHLIAKGALGCQPCSCSLFGSSRNDCEQLTGRCQCKENSFGSKCDSCDPDSFMTPNGCRKKAEYMAPKSCTEMRCYHGAECIMDRSGLPDCICPSGCFFNDYSDLANITICGSDGNTYDNFCELTKFACKHQLDLVPASLGICHSQENEMNDIQIRRGRKLETASMLGTFCATNQDCKTYNAYCAATIHASIKICKCRERFFASNDGKQCIQNDHASKSFSTTFSFYNNSSAIFSGFGFTNGTLRIRLRIKTSRESGILLFSLTSDNLNHLMINLYKSRIILSISDDGNPIIMESEEIIAIHHPYIIEAAISESLITMNIGDNVQFFKTSSMKSLKAYSCTYGQTYVGHLPADLAEKYVGYISNFSGCISIMINGEMFTSDHLIIAHKLGECDFDMCNDDYCLNGGECVKMAGGKFACICQSESGVNCGLKQIGTCENCEINKIKETNKQDFEAAESSGVEFSGENCVKVKDLKFDLKKTLEVEIWLKTMVSDGLVFYWANKQGNFVALAIANLQPLFVFNLGAETVYVRSKVSLSNERFHSIRFGRNLRNAFIQVNSNIKYRLSVIKYNRGMYEADLHIGCFSDIKMLPETLKKLATLFKGVVQRISINGQSVIFWKSSEISLYKGPPCTEGRCGKAHCFAKLNDYECRCKPNTSVEFCDPSYYASQSRKMAYFDGSTGYSYLNKAVYGAKRQQKISYSFWFKTVASNGLIIWQSNMTNGNNDYLAIFLTNGSLGFAIMLDKKSSQKVLQKKVNDGKWHAASFLRNGEKAELIMFAEKVVIGLPSHNFVSNGIVRIGGKNVRNVRTDSYIITPYIGCLGSVDVGDRELNLWTDALFGQAPKICR